MSKDAIMRRSSSPRSHGDVMKRGPEHGSQELVFCWQGAPNPGFLTML